MGGQGSGRTPSATSKPTLNGAIALNVGRVTGLLKMMEPGGTVPIDWMTQPLEGMFNPRPRGPRVLRYRAWLTSTDQGFDLEFVLRDGTERFQVVRLTYTSQHLGGRRTWFECPGVNSEPCGRRVGVLWLDREFACRMCHGVVYESQREDAITRAHRRSAKARLALGAEPWRAHFMGARPERPKRMRFRTYLRGLVKIAEADRAVWDTAVRRAGYATTNDLGRALEGDPDAPEPSMAIRWGKT